MPPGVFLRIGAQEMHFAKVFHIFVPQAYEMQRTQITNRTNGILTGFAFTVFRLALINTATGLRILQAIMDQRSPTEIAALHRNRAKRAEIEKCASVELPDYLRVYLSEVLRDVRNLNQRIQQAEATLLVNIEPCGLSHQVELMCTVPVVTRMLALRMIAEMGANYHQRYYSAAAFSKGIGVVPSSEVSGGN
jgi:hypothetical protein